MNLIKVSAVAEILSSIAIVLTLVYLAIQTQHAAIQTELNTASNLSAIRQSMMEADMTMVFASNGILRSDPDTMSEEGLIDFLSAYIAHARSRELYWAEYTAGNLDEETYRSYMQVFINLTFRSEYTQALWKNSPNYRPGFIEAVNVGAAELNLLVE